MISLANFSTGISEARDNVSASTSLSTFYSLIELVLLRRRLASKCAHGNERSALHFLGVLMDRSGSRQANQNSGSIRLNFRSAVEGFVSKLKLAKCLADLAAARKSPLDPAAVDTALQICPATIPENTS
jgi:hypothetical protein